jgi:hypothetical protein
MEALRASGGSDGVRGQIRRIIDRAITGLIQVMPLEAFVKANFSQQPYQELIADFSAHEVREELGLEIVISPNRVLQGGGDLYRLSRVLGHSTLQMSARYGHLRTDDLHDELRTLAQKRSQERQTKAPELSEKPSPESPDKPFKPLKDNGLRRFDRMGVVGAPGTIRTSDPQIRRMNFGLFRGRRTPDPIAFFRRLIYCFH